MRIRLHCPNAGIFISVHLWSDTHILVTFQASTVPIVVLNERYIQLYTLEIPELLPHVGRIWPLIWRQELVTRNQIYPKAGNGPL